MNYSSIPKHVNGCTIEVCEWISNFIPHFIWGTGCHYMTELIIDNTFVWRIPSKQVAVCRNRLETGLILAVCDIFIRYPFLTHTITWCCTVDKLRHHSGQRFNTQIATIFLILWMSWNSSEMWTKTTKSQINFKTNIANFAVSAALFYSFLITIYIVSYYDSIEALQNRHKFWY